MKPADLQPGDKFAGWTVAGPPIPYAGAPMTWGVTMKHSTGGQVATFHFPNDLGLVVERPRRRAEFDVEDVESVLANLEGAGVSLRAADRLQAALDALDLNR